MAQADTLPHCVELCSRMASAQKNGELCDLVLVCNGQTITVHKLVVCLHSPVIKAACTGPFMEASGLYEIQDCSFDDVQRLVEFLYTGDYQEKAPGQAEDVHELVVHVTMFSLADVYIIDGLLTLSKNKFRAAVKQESAIDVLLRHVPRVYELQCESSSVLRDIIIGKLREKIANSIDLITQQALESMLEEQPEFARDIAKSFIKRPLPARAGRCLNCDCTSCQLASIALRHKLDRLGS